MAPRDTHCPASPKRLALQTRLALKVCSRSPTARLAAAEPVFFPQCEHARSAEQVLNQQDEVRRPCHRSAAVTQRGSRSPTRVSSKLYSRQERTTYLFEGPPIRFERRQRRDKGADGTASGRRRRHRHCLLLQPQLLFHVVPRPNRGTHSYSTGLTTRRGRGDDAFASAHPDAERRHPIGGLRGWELHVE